MDTNVDQLLTQAVNAGASDLHLKVGSPPVARIAGELRRLEGFDSLRPEDIQALAEELLPPQAEAELKEAGSADFAYGRQDVGRFRVNAFRQRGSVSLVLRRVMPGARSFAELGLPNIVEKLARSDSGLLVVSGPTGSGKTATLASILDWINANRAASILTVEDPIEVLYPDKRSVVVQREVGVDTPHAAEAIRGAMRHDTDVILVSDIDDPETARAAIVAAETGHLVLTSMRTTDPADTIDRIVSLFPVAQHKVVRTQLAGQLIAVISQRLLDHGEGAKVLACEVLTANERAKEWIVAGGDATALIEIIRESEFFGMQTFDQALLNLVTQRRIAIPVALPFVRNTHEFRAKALEAGIEV